MNVNQVKELYDNAKTFANTKSILKRTNELMSYEPVFDVHEDKYVQNFELVCNRMLSSGLAKSKTDLLSKLNSIVGIITRFKKDPSELRQKIMELKLDTTKELPDAQPQNDARPWSEMLKIFQHEIDNNKNRFAKIMCVCFKHGYVLRCGEIFNTTTALGFPKSAGNYLDINSKQWTINEHKTAADVPTRKFPVTAEFIAELRKYIEVPEFLLIYKSNFSAYSTALLKSIDIDSFTNNEARNSYEEWNWRNSGRTLAEKRFWSEKVLGHSEQVAKQFYTAHTMESRILTADDPSVKFLEDTTGKIASSGKFKLKIKPKVKPTN